MSWSAGDRKGAMSGRRRWATRPATGRMVDHPTVVAAARIWSSDRTPRLVERSGTPIVSYCRTRVYLDRDAWEMLPDDGVLLMRVQPTEGPRFVLALTADELDKVFGEVRATASWRDARCYDFPSEPPAARAFVVNVDGVTGLPGGSGSNAPPPAAIRTIHPRASPGVRPSAPVAVAAVRKEPSGSFEEWAATWYERLGARPESPDYLHAVAAWRTTWRPERVRVVLLAESHVGEHPGDSRIGVTSLYWVGRSLPDRYVRLIYCLGYGESSICSRPPESNGGTPQFWNIFGQVALGQSPPRKAESSLAHRLRWKVRVLEELRHRGIWLQDASPLGVYLGRGQRLDHRHYVKLLREGYQRYVWPSFAADAPEQVWVIGKGVSAALAGLPGIDPGRFITQPQDRNRAQHLEGLEHLRLAAQ